MKHFIYNEKDTIIGSISIIEDEVIGDDDTVVVLVPTIIPSTAGPRVSKMKLKKIPREMLDAS